MLRRCARNYLQISDLGQAGQNLILDTVGKVSVVWISATDSRTEALRCFFPAQVVLIARDNAKTLRYQRQLPRA